MLRRITRNGGVGVRSVRRWFVLSCAFRDDLKRRSVSPRPLALFRPRPRRGPRARAKKKKRKRAVAFSTKNRCARIRRRGKEREGRNARRSEQRWDGGPAVNEDARGNRGPRGPQK